MGSNLLYDLYEFRLQKELVRDQLPKHIAVILDGNRRWAKAVGSSASEGHLAGASRISDFLEWSEEVGISVVTLWMLSTDNLAREKDELDSLLEIICSTVEGLAGKRRWKIGIVGDLSLVPERFAKRLEAAARSTAELNQMLVNVAVGYGGRHELVDAVKQILLEAHEEGKDLQQVASGLSVNAITEHLYTKGQPDPDLIIRTSGEQRLSGFMLWQAAHSEYYFCDTYWPDFRKVDFLRALRSYGQRERRLGR